MRRPVAVVTGASAGIGRELSKVFARHGHDVVLVARRADRLAGLAAEIGSDVGRRPHILPLDLALPGAAKRIAAALEDSGLEAEYVVNNAGFGLLGRAAELDRDAQLRMIDLNVRTLTELSLAFAGSLARRRGGILNVASVAGFLPGPQMAVYYATKAYVLSFSEALHREMRSRGVRVTVLCPGPVPTEFQAVAGLTGATASILDVPAARVAEAGYRGLMAGRRLVVPGLLNRVVTLLPRILPRGLVLQAMHMRQKRRR